eukprot:COSAG03_NODE_11969_length_568_cov_1.095949_2_plen_70_part_01
MFSNIAGGLAADSVLAREFSPPSAPRSTEGWLDTVRLLLLFKAAYYSSSARLHPLSSLVPSVSSECYRCC